VIDWWFQSRVESKYSVYAVSFSFMVSTVIRVLLIMTNSSLLAFVWVSLIEIVINSIFFVIIYFYKRESIKRWKFSLNLAWRFIKDCFPLMVSGIALIIQTRIDQILIGNFLGDQVTG